jgi:hypothetical protein
LLLIVDGYASKANYRIGIQDGVLQLRPTCIFWYDGSARAEGGQFHQVVQYVSRGWQ